MENQNMNPSLFQNYTWNTIHNNNDSLHDHNIDMVMDHNHHQHLYAHHPFTPSTQQVFQESKHDQNHHPQEIEELDEEEEEEDNQELGAMKEMMYKIAAMQPVDIDPATVRRPRRRNVKISSDPQSVAARHRRERISEKIRILQRLVPGGTKMDTATMLDEAIRYVKFLKRQIRVLQSNYHNPPPTPAPEPAPGGFTNKNDDNNPSSAGLGSPPGFVTDGYEPPLLI